MDFDARLLRSFVSGLLLKTTFSSKLKMLILLQHPYNGADVVVVVDTNKHRHSHRKKPSSCRVYDQNPTKNANYNNKNSHNQQATQPNQTNSQPASILLRQFKSINFTLIASRKYNNNNNTRNIIKSQPQRDNNNSISLGKFFLHPIFSINALLHALLLQHVCSEHKHILQ